MRSLGRMLLVLLVPVLALGQAHTSNNGSTNGSMADELKQLREAIAQQQQQIAQQQKQIDTLQTALSQKNGSEAHLQDASLRVNNTQPSATPAAAVVQEAKETPKESPLSFRIGGTEFTPGGFLDFENVFRTTNTGNQAATNFWAIPFSNTVAGHLTEFRSMGQYSRFNLKVTGKYGLNNLTGYIESDFNGNDATNVFVTSNSHTLRMRLYWLNLKRGPWEVLAGQTWGLQTPNRVGISPNPSDLQITYGEDAQTHVGLNYTRAAAFRVGYHFNDNFVWAVELQNPQQFAGQGAEVVFPSQFNAQLTNGAAGGTAQIDPAASNNTPNLMPDYITKFAYDKNISGKHFHFEGGGLITSAKVTVLPSVAGASFSEHSNFGGGVFAGANFEPVKNLRFVGSGMYGPGVGRYLIAMGPQVVVVPIAAANSPACVTGNTGGCDVRLSPVHAGDAIVGIEAQPHPKTQIGVYAGAAYFQRNTFPDFTAAPAVKPFIGFGGPNSGQNNNRLLQEVSLDWTQTFWKNPQYGAVLLVTQASYVSRAPWFVAAGAPKNAHLAMGYVSFRYQLP